MKAKQLIGILVLGSVLFASAAAFAADRVDEATFRIDRGGESTVETNAGSSTHGTTGSLAASPEGITVDQTARVDKVAVRATVSVDPGSKVAALDRCFAAYQIEQCDASELSQADLIEHGPAGPNWLGDALALD
ncbi:MAG TPA: hypothetical protein VGB52_09920 [Actinomycetota bacterium]|jgi:hypothetical protein